MARIEFANGIADDIERIAEHLHQHDVHDVETRIQNIAQAIGVLEHNPLIGRPAEHEMRELVIGRRTSGYIALYVYIGEIDTVFVLALRNQVEAGYARD
jgi:plasmid stabilization system protein ParE